MKTPETEIKKYPRFDGSQNCASIGVDSYYEYEVMRSHKQRVAVINTLKDSCNSCPFIDECFTWAIHHEMYGFWAGTTSDERIKIRKKMDIKFIDPMTYVYESLYNYRLGRDK